MKLMLKIAVVVWVLVSGLGNTAGAAAPRVAVWDPVQGTTETRFHFDRAAQDRMLTWLQEAGVTAKRVTAEQIKDPTLFSAQQYDALIFITNAFPRSTVEALKEFSDKGGVLVALGAEVPFLIGIEPGADGQWVLSPREPKFAWETKELLKFVGLQYIFKVEMHNLGTTHLATPLLKQYLPEATDLRGRLSSRWILPLAGAEPRAEIFPLLRSQRRDKADVPSQLYVVRYGQRHTIVSTSDVYTSEAQPTQWALGSKTLVALVRLAKDLHDRTITLKPEMAVQIHEDLAVLPTMPLDRVATGSVEPDHAPVVSRWGRFDGSNEEFGPKLAAGEKRELRVGAPAEEFPVALEAGASVRLLLPSLGQGPLFFRVRGAYTATEAALKVTLGDNDVLNESFVYIDASGPSNFSHSLAGVPCEFTRIAFIPPSQAVATVLTLSNPGKAALYFDAVQIERHTAPTPERSVGLGAGYGNNYPAEESQKWNAIRTSLRTNFIGPPDDPNRFKKLDELFNKLYSKNPNLEPILEGTPPWAAISSDRLTEAQVAKRPTTVPPDPVKYAQIVEDVVQRYGDRIRSYEIWNEADINQFYRGTPDEYIHLLKIIVPILRKHAPHARIMTTGMSGYHEEFLRKLVDSGALKLVDMIAFHPYAGKGPAWDMPYGLLEGSMLSRGVDTEIYCNESGFPFSNSEWSQPPPYTPEFQADRLNVAMARVLASGLAKISVFNAGGDEQPFGLFDGKGHPRLAYHVFTDYLQLAGHAAHRLDVSLTSTQGIPLQGIYTAASTHDDGSVTLVVNPAEADALRPAVNPTPELNGAAKWTCFFGEARFASGKATITPAANQKNAGFYKLLTLNPDQFPILEVTASGTDSDWELLLKTSDGVSLAAMARQGTGTTRVNLHELLKKEGRQDLEVSFRIYKPTTLEAVRFLPSPDAPATVKPLSTRLCVPLPKSLSYKATLSVGGVESPLEVQIHESPAQPWAELLVSLKDRTIIRLRPN